MGLCARVTYPHIADPEHATVRAAIHLLPPVLGGLVLAAVLSAVRSTADSQLLVAASAFARDLWQKVFKKAEREKTMLILSRLVVLILGVAATLLALTKLRAVFWFVLFSWAGLGASFAPVLILAIYWRRLTNWGAAAGMLSGSTMVILWRQYLKDAVIAAGGPKIYELVPGFLTCLLVCIFVSLITGKARQQQ
jgi:sodium/proline symporter